MPLRRPSARRCPKAFPLPVSMLSLPILNSVRLRTLGSTSQRALEQFSARVQFSALERLSFMLQTGLEGLAEWCCICFSATAEPEISDALSLNVGLWPVTRGLWPAWWFGCGGERPSTARGDELQGGLDMSCQESWIMGLHVLRFQPLCSCLSNWLWFTPWQISQHYYDLIAQGGICLQHSGAQNSP